MSAWVIKYEPGDQGPLKWKFDASYMKVCPRCAGTDIAEEKIASECRMNGDACGVNVFTCLGCAWATSFLWDDSAESYYYERSPVASKDDAK